MYRVCRSIRGKAIDLCVRYRRRRMRISLSIFQQDIDPFIRNLESILANITAEYGLTHDIKTVDVTNERRQP